MLKPTPFFILLVCFILLPVSCLAAAGPLSGRIIVLDPGHGGTEDGAVANGVREADVNLAVGLKLRDRLAAAGAAVVMTRTADRSVASPGSALPAELQARVDLSRAADADIFISIHANSHFKPETAGVITFYPPERPTELARAIQEGLVGQTGAVDKKIRPANFYVLRNSEIPAVLVETGFLTNQEEARKLADCAYQEAIAEGICQGVVRYFSSRER
ncbi:MAG TPA: N-acetylmuramoyl-L-alanine amidase [Selenomonadales bacterium]|nr:N-acetylmuramoyl-L-alanine amidase [Selenomonadales bacterium]